MRVTTPWLASAAAGVALAAAPPELRAQPVAPPIGGDIALDGFRPALDARGFVTVDGGDVLAAGEPSFGLVTTWARGLLDREGYHVGDVVSPTLVAAIGGPWSTELAASLPFGILEANERAAQGVGDLAVHGKLRLLERRPWIAAVALGVTVPTASGDRWLGGTGALGGRGILEWRAGRWRIGANLGVRTPLGGDVVFADMDMTVALGPSIPGGAAVAWAITPGRLDVIGEVGGAMPLRGDLRPVEATLALRVRLAEASHFTIGAGTGLGEAAGSPDLRAFAAILFEPRSGRVMRTVVEDPAAPPPAAPGPGDRDDDTFLDTVDACPDEPEDLDDHDDGDGCPDVDNDHDGFLDVDELCPDDPEDRDGVEDDDGCPERPRVEVSEGALELFEDIHFEFDSAVIQERSHELLRVVATTLAANADIRLVEIGGHTDDRGSAGYNRDLSQRRADAVRTFLIGEGVAEDRLVARGFGEDRPKIRRRGERAWRANRRVELLIKARE